MADLLIRRYRAADAPAVQRLAPDAPPLQEVIEAGGQAWVAERQGQLLAYACAAPLPGLPDHFDLQGCVSAAARRQGIGSRLLNALLSALGEQGAREISCAVERLDGPTARFLQARDFTLHHEEWRMILRALDALPPAPDVPDCQAQTLPRRQAISTFRRLSDESFAGAPWYQPYSEEEVAADLGQAQDVLFWVCDGKPVGFVWAHRQGAAGAQIEPVGVLPGARGRGYGRALLLAALHRLARRGVSHAHLAVWRENTAAIGLYKELGFQRNGRRYYLAYEISRL